MRRPFKLGDSPRLIPGEISRRKGIVSCLSMRAQRNVHERQMAQFNGADLPSRLCNNAARLPIEMIFPSSQKSSTQLLWLTQPALEVQT